MSDALEQASLIMVPSGYENGTLGSLKPLDGTGDFTFSRGSDISATRVNEDGYIEKGYENLLLQSNSFTESNWGLFNASLTSGQAGYDGTNNAWLLESTGASGNTRDANLSITGVATLSVYFKKQTSQWASIELRGGSTSRAFFDLENGIVGNLIQCIDATITSIGNGWYRCSLTTSSSTIGTITRTSLLTASANGTLGQLGDNVLLQDAQINQGLVAYPYVETTTAPVAGGILEDMPRLDYSGSCPALLLEPQRTNLISYSEYFQGWHSNANVSFSINEATSPEGLINATKLTATSTSNSFVRDNRTTSAGENVFSVFAKYEDCQYIRLNSRFFVGGDEASVWFDIQNGVKGGSTEDNVTYEIEDYGNGWYRCYVIFNVDAGDTNGYCYVYLSSADESFNVINGTGALLYGGQLEEGSYPTSYIPTYGTSQTRLADDASNTNTIDADNDFTFYLESTLMPEGFTGKYFDNQSNGYLSGYNIAGSNLRHRYSGTNYAFTSPEGVFKYLIRKDSTNMKFYLNGVLERTITTLPTGTNDLELLGGKVHKTLLFPTALSDDECIALTTIS